MPHYEGMAEIDDLMLKHFGPQPDGLFLAVGRLSALTSLLDVWVRNLLAAVVDAEPMAKYENLDFHAQAKLIREKSSILPPDLRREVKRLLGRLAGLRSDRNAGVHTVWSQPGFGWRNDPNREAGEAQRVLTFDADKAQIEAKVLRAARMVDQLVDLQDRCNRLHSQRAYDRMIVQPLSRGETTSKGTAEPVNPNLR